MTKRSYIKYKKLINKCKISNILAQEGKSLQQRYDEWEKKVQEIQEQCEVKKKKNKKNKNIRILLRVKRKIKKGVQNKINKVRRNLINHHIREEQYTKYENKVKRAIEDLRRNGRGVKEESFWDFKRKLGGQKKETPVGMKNEDGVIVHEPQKIKEVYKDFYTKLFHNPKEEEIKQAVDKKMEEIKKKAEKQTPLRTKRKTVERVVKELKRGKAKNGNAI